MPHQAKITVTPEPVEDARRLRREFAFLLSDVARLLRTVTDQHAREYGSTRAQWAVLVRIAREEGQSQAELADTLDIQPITLTRLVDRLCEEGLVERRADPADRRVRRLHLTAKAGPVLDQLGQIGAQMMGQVLAGIGDDDLCLLVRDLGTIKGNLKAQLRTGPADAEARTS